MIHDKSKSYIFKFFCYFFRESFELNSTQKEFVQTMIEKIYSLLKETPPDGEKFAQIVVNIFQREEHWNIWKNEGCPGNTLFNLS